MDELTTDDRHEAIDEADDNDGRFDPAMDVTERELEESSEDIVNPERGFYAGVNLLATGDMSGLRARGHSMVIAVVRLDDYRDRPLDAPFFTAMQAGFDAGAAAGIKYILRFSYNAAFAPDAPLSQVLQHIEQLAPYLQANAHVISVVQAGFIGAWGEWHSSTNGLDNDQARAAILSALLNAVPEHRFIQIRAPMFKENAYPGGPITAAESFTGTARARIGHHNDCFLASSNDFGTYDAPVDQWMNYVASDTKYSPMGGETCAVYAPRTDCPVATSVMRDHHWSYLNSEYNVLVLQQWEQQGCMQEVRQRLGYRLAAQRIKYAGEVQRGGKLPVEVDLVNRGYAAPYNERPVYLVLTGNGTSHIERLADANPRRWYGGETVRVSGALSVPADLPPGDYSLALWLPDAAPELANDPRYAVHLANTGVWDAPSGYNVLASDIVVR